mgnify:CR=1 FL=1
MSLAGLVLATGASCTNQEPKPELSQMVVFDNYALMGTPTEIVYGSIVRTWMGNDIDGDRINELYMRLSNGRIFATPSSLEGETRGSVGDRPVVWYEVESRPEGVYALRR